ncbi:MAG TPA: DUF1361 domain-containing protein [Myxococcales bacterium]|jgi:uncharacterized membrane protein
MSPQLDLDRVRLPAVGRGRSAALLVISGLAVALWAARAWYAGPQLQFLLWNLFLAAIPWAAARTFAAVRSPTARVAGATAWLLFLPNAPYLVTDLVHLRARPPVPMLFDVLLFATFALAGCALGWASLEQVHLRLARALGAARSGAAIGAAILLAGFGVYLGRFHRWNSWDVLTRPQDVLAGCASALHSPRALVFSALVAAFVGAGYLLFAGGGVRDESRASP